MHNNTFSRCLILSGFVLVLAFLGCLVGNKVLAQVVVTADPNCNDSDGGFNPLQDGAVNTNADWCQSPIPQTNNLPLFFEYVCKSQMQGDYWAPYSASVEKLNGRTNFQEQTDASGNSVFYRIVGVCKYGCSGTSCKTKPVDQPQTCDTIPTTFHKDCKKCVAGVWVAVNDLTKTCGSVGGTCQNGFCVVAPGQCTETDDILTSNKSSGGINVNKKGVTTFSDGKVKEDKCGLLGKRLYEQSCDDDVSIASGAYWSSVEGAFVYDCPEKCQDGQCVQEDVQPIPSTEINCSDGIDNDSDNLIDCTDTDCESKSCGRNKTCKNHQCVAVDANQPGPIQPPTQPGTGPAADNYIDIKPPNDICSSTCKTVESFIAIGKCDTAADKKAACEACLNCIAHPERTLVVRVMGWLAWFGFIIAGLVILIAAFMYMISGGVPAKQTKARQIIIWAVVGLAVLASGRLILGIVGWLFDIKF